MAALMFSWNLKNRGSWRAFCISTTRSPWVNGHLNTVASLSPRKFMVSRKIVEIVVKILISMMLS